MLRNSAQSGETQHGSRRTPSRRTRPPRTPPRRPPRTLRHLARAAAAILLATTLASCAGATAAAPPPAPTTPTAAAPPPAPATPTPTPALLTEPGQIGPIYAALASARTTIDMTMYELEDPTAEGALAAAARRGVKVRVLLDGGYYGSGAPANAGASAYLRAHNVQVRSSPSYFALTHQKTITVDHRRSLIMTLNLTAQYYVNTRDFAIEDVRPADVQAIESVFEADWTRHRIIPPAGAGDLVWSPGAESALVGLIDHARTSLDVENEEMADQPVIAALCRASKRGVRVRVVMTYASKWAQPLASLAGCGAQVHLFHGETPLYIHAKEIVADGSRAYVGSENFSYTSLERNRELGVITTSRPVLGSLESTFTSDFSAARAAARAAARRAGP